MTEEQVVSALKAGIVKLTESRVQVDISNKKLRMAAEILTDLLNEEVVGPKSKSTAPPALSKVDYLCSLQFKNNLSQHPSFKNLCVYLTSLRSEQARAKRLQEFFNQILYASDKLSVAIWYDAMNEGCSLLDALVNSKSNPFKADDKAE